MSNTSISARPIVDISIFHLPPSPSFPRLCRTCFKSLAHSSSLYPLASLLTYSYFLPPLCTYRPIDLSIDLPTYNNVRPFLPNNSFPSPSPSSPPIAQGERNVQDLTDRTFFLDRISNSTSTPPSYSSPTGISKPSPIPSFPLSPSPLQAFRPPRPKVHWTVAKQELNVSFVLSPPLQQTTVQKYKDRVTPTRRCATAYR